MEVSFADVAHQALTFSTADPSEHLILKLIDTRWIQRLRQISQTGNTKLVYMFAEHSRFGHSLGVAYLANTLMKKLFEQHADLVRPYRNAVSAAAVLHDIGHVAPGSHLGERVWGSNGGGRHEVVSCRAIAGDPQIKQLLDGCDPALSGQVCGILRDDPEMPSWTRAILSGGGWNADRGNWAIVDSAMCSVTYGRYNVAALIDAFRLTEDGLLVLQESRLDALTHFFVARDSMYRQVYQHRVLQAVDVLTRNIVLRLRDLFVQGDAKAVAAEHGIFCDAVMQRAIAAGDYTADLNLDELFRMNESWWNYHVHTWCDARDPILQDLASRLRDRRLWKTIRLESSDLNAGGAGQLNLVDRAREAAAELGFDPRYYVSVLEEADKHRGKTEEPPLALLDSGELISAAEVEPLIGEILKRSYERKRWLVAPKEVKERLGRSR